MSKPIFKSGKMCINHPGEPLEEFPLVNGAAFMFFTERKKELLSVELGTDWVDFEDSELIGGSETLLSVWGIPASKTDVADGLKNQIALASPGVNASFFASVGHRIDSYTVEFPGQNRIRLAITIDDITEETDDSNTVVTFDDSLVSECKLKSPN